MYGLSRITIGSFYGEVEMSPDVAELEIKLDARENYYKVEFYNSSEHQSFPSAHAPKTPKVPGESRAAFKSLTSGKTIVNLKGAAVDCVMVDPLSSGGLLVRALCIAHTEQDLKLKKNQLENDQAKAMNAIKVSPLLSTLKCITVHLSNRSTHHELEPSKIKNCVVIGINNSSAFFGPVLSRGLWSKIHLFQNTSLETVGTKCKFSTFSCPPEHMRRQWTPPIARTVRWAVVQVVKKFVAK
jgi:hypothetical protein